MMSSAGSPTTQWSVARYKRVTHRIFIQYLKLKKNNAQVSLIVKQHQCQIETKTTYAQLTQTSILNINIMLVLLMEQ